MLRCRVVPASLALSLVYACAPAGDERVDSTAARSVSPFGDGEGLLADPAVLTCEEAQSAGDPRTHWQLWLDAVPEGGFVYRRAQNVFDPWEGTITLEVETLGEFDDCRAAASEPRIITCFRPGASFLVTAWVEETSIPLGGADLFTTSRFDVTWQETGPADRERLSFFYFDDECWATADDRLGS